MPSKKKNESRPKEEWVVESEAADGGVKWPSKQLLSSVFALPVPCASFESETTRAQLLLRACQFIPMVCCEPNLQSGKQTMTSCPSLVARWTLTIARKLQRALHSTILQPLMTLSAT
jgi:hypothetical protein